MDLDALKVARSGEWNRLDALSRSRHLSGAEVDEMVARYRAASADLADVKTSAGRTVHGDYLSTTIGRARFRLTGASENVLRQVPRFFQQQLPAALYRVRWATLIIAAVFVLIGLIVAVWVTQNPDVLAALGSQAQLQQYAEESFVDYYSEKPAAVFGATVWSNNAWIAAQSVLFGFTGIWPIYVLIQNAVGVGSAAAILFSFGYGDVFFLYILPHGLLELTCVFVAIAAGLRIFWAIVAPGRRSRIASMAEEGRALTTVAIGLIFALALAGLVEAFVTPQPWHPAIKIGLGALALAVFLFYMLLIGRRAFLAGQTGDLTEYESGTPTLVAG